MSVVYFAEHHACRKSLTNTTHLRHIFVKDVRNPFQTLMAVVRVELDRTRIVL